MCPCEHTHTNMMETEKKMEGQRERDTEGGWCWLIRPVLCLSKRDCKPFKPYPDTPPTPTFSLHTHTGSAGINPIRYQFSGELRRIRINPHVSIFMDVLCFPSLTVCVAMVKGLLNARFKANSHKSPTTYAHTASSVHQKSDQLSWTN